MDRSDAKPSWHALTREAPDPSPFRSAAGGGLSVGVRVPAVVVPVVGLLPYRSP